MAGNRLLPAGSYIVTRPGETHTQLTIQSKQGQHGGVMVQPNISQPVNTHGATKLVFNRYGDRYFLSQVWTSKRREGYVLRQSDQERGLARELAQNGNRRPEVVSIAASVP